ncbi:MAG: hypothetical protein WC458_01360 [Patescibacteria group bacterium]
MEFSPFYLYPAFFVTSILSIAMSACRCDVPAAVEVQLFNGELSFVRDISDTLLPPVDWLCPEVQRKKGQIRHNAQGKGLSIKPACYADNQTIFSQPIKLTGEKFASFISTSSSLKLLYYI